MMCPFLDSIVDDLRQDSARRLYGVLEMSRLDADDRASLLDKFQQRAWPLLDSAEFSNIRGLGPWIFTAREPASLEGQYDFQGILTDLAGDALCGWISSALLPDELVSHLGQVGVVYGPDGARYMLRYQTETVLLVMHGRRDQPGFLQFWGPLSAWWVPMPSRKPGAWRHFPGGKLATPVEVPALRFDQPDWDVLAGDPLSDQLAELLRDPLQETPVKKIAACHGYRVALARELLAQARQLGLTCQDDLIEYVTFTAMAGRSLEKIPAWEQALDAARRGESTLVEAVRRYMN